MAAEGWRERSRDADDLEQVGLELGTDVIEWRLEHRRAQGHASVVDDVEHRRAQGHASVVDDD
jgi:hypothetical protein